MEQYYKIADLNVKMECSGRTQQQAQPYLCTPCSESDVDIRLLYNNYSKALETNRILFPFASEDHLQYITTGACFYSHLSKFNGLMIHSSSVVVDGRAYLFTANPGTGKSTHTSLWLKQFGERAYILNDDKPAVRLIDGIWYAYGTPWSGKQDISTNIGVPLAGIAILERGEINRITHCDLDYAVNVMCTQLQTSQYPDRMELMLDLFDKLIADVPIWKLECNMDPEAAIVSYEAMSGEKFVPTTEK